MKRIILTFVKILMIFLMPVAAILIVVLLCYYSVERAARNRLYEDPEDIPQRNAALLLGCAKKLPDGRNNLYFIYRTRSAAQLYHSGACKYIIVSGDNSRKDYDEPTDMQDALTQLGVPAEKIYRDFAGFRTLDSVVRAREIFGQKELIVVSQAFHNTRAIYLAEKHGLDAIGLNCRDVGSIGGLRTRLREYLARVKTVLDVSVFGTEPKFYGPKVELGGPRPQHGD